MRVTITGTLLDTTRETGSFTPPGEIEERSWDFTQLHILQGRIVTKVRLPKDVHRHNFTQGEQVSVEADIAGTPKLVADIDSLGLTGRAA